MLLLSLKQVGLLTSQLYRHLHGSSRKTPLLYGLPKLHKPGIPLRPIVSFIDSPTYNLSKHLVSLLSPLTGMSSSHVRNSTEFARFIAGQHLSEGEVLFCYDVVSLSQMSLWTWHTVLLASASPQIHLWRTIHRCPLIRSPHRWSSIWALRTFLSW